MPKTISGSVGRGGRNFPPVDVMTIQYLLNCVPAMAGGPSPELAVDGAAGPRTIAAIEKFQRANGCACDGRVDAGGTTLRVLQGKAQDPYPNQALVQGTAKTAPGQPGGKMGPGSPGQKSVGGVMAGPGFGAKGFPPGPAGAKGVPGGPGGPGSSPHSRGPGNPFGAKGGF